MKKNSNIKIKMKQQQKLNEKTFLIVINRECQAVSISEEKKKQPEKR